MYVDSKITDNYFAATLAKKHLQAKKVFSQNAVLYVDSLSSDNGFVAAAFGLPKQQNYSSLESEDAS